ncbi:site-specific recombinase XerD [Desulfosporosinus orientis DSM 765]|uniref:Site-specific recombinase XerD n=1 Tax=Desulfosporosinus orientis (strain ATCC 19365 / DSM 765 / NCIMB 8382 / VKM B-1628 / Singapore I) TaxID=768706 RepID=G7WFF7_DESOD|nr:tyrosine-type recombinase/integrase [Desulfosporosinus orientis]AET68400.1 site-specific recombinase XerD [Desulfosporosinus orientis DSM 765]
MDTRFNQYPLPSFAKDFINHLAVTNKSKSTQVAYTYELCMFFQYLCGLMPDFPSSSSDIQLSDMARVGHRHIESYLSWSNTERANGSRALARKQTVIRSLYRYLLREEMIHKDITIKLDPININQKLPKALEPNEIADLTDALETGIGLSEGQLKYHVYTEKRDYAIVLTLIGTGLRLSELCNLDISKTNLNKGYFEILRKGNKETVIYFNEDVGQALNDYLLNERPRYVRQDVDALFLSMQGKRISKRAVQNLIAKYMTILKTLGHNTEGFSVHKMRSTFATLLLRETDNLAIVQDALGHSDPRTTRIYAKVLDEQLKQAANLIKFK